MAGPMRMTWVARLTSWIAAAAVCAGLPTVYGAADTNWLQWGGPSRDSVTDVKGLASSWPAAGPTRLWTRGLGEGHSAVLADSGRLYTMYRPRSSSPEAQSQEEVVVSLDASTGSTLWEHRYAASTRDLDFSRGAGPYSTPLIAGSRLFATSTRKQLFALEKTTGKRLWSHDLIKEYGSPAIDSYLGGYTCSPLAYNGTIIVTLGGAGQAVAAFDERTGALVWKNGTFAASPSSPALIDVDGQEQLVVFGGDAITGLDPTTGRTLWSHPHRTDYGLSISTPVWSPTDHLLFVSSAYSSGSRVLELRQKDGNTIVSEKWYSRRLRVHFSSVIRIGGHAFASSGDFGPGFMTAVDLKTGQILWQDRTFARAQLLRADGKLIILDEDGQLGLATVSTEGLKVLARAAILENISWTPPTLAGTILYARDRKNIVAFELGSRQ